MKKSILKITFVLMVNSFYAQSFNTVFSEANVKDDAREQMYINEEAVVHLSLLSPTNKTEMFAPRTKIYHDNFQVVKVQSISKNQKRVFMEFNLEISNEDCLSIDLGRQVITCDVYYFFKENTDVKRNWLGENVKICTGRQLIPNIDRESITLLYHTIFPHKDFDESRLAYGCSEPKEPNYDKKNIRVNADFTNISVYTSNKTRVNLIDYIKKIADDKPLVLITWKLLEIRSSLVVMSAEMDLVEKFKDKLVVLSINREDDYSDYRSMTIDLPNSQKERMLWSPKDELDADSYTTITKSTMTPDIFFFKGGELRYYRQGDGNYSSEELSKIMNDGIAQLMETDSNYSEVNGLIRVTNE